MPSFFAYRVACFGWALGSVWSVRGLPGGFKLKLADGAAGWASQMLCGGAMLLVASWALGEQLHGPYEARAVASWCYTVVAGTLVGYTAYMVLLVLAKRTPA